LKLWRPITTIFCVPCTTTWKHIKSSLWMNTSDLIFQLLCINSPPKLVILTPHHFPYTPCDDCAITFADYVNTSIYCTNTSSKCANKFTNCAHTSNDYVNTSVDSINTLNTPTVDFCILDFSFYISWSIILKNTHSSFLQLSFNDLFIFWSSEINIILASWSSISYSFFFVLHV